MVKKTSEYYEDGYTAYYEGKNVEDSPHTRLSEHFEWCAGWRQAKMDSDNE